MTLRGTVFALLWSALLAVAVLSAVRASGERDSARLSWLLGRVEGPAFLVASDDTGTLARERNEVVRYAIERMGRDRDLAANLALGVHVTLALAAVFVLLGERGASAGWAAAGTAAAALLLQALGRFGHPSWLLVGGFVPWLASLRALAAEARVRRWLACVAWLVFIWATSRLWFHGAILVTAGAVFALATRSRGDAAATLSLLAIAAALALLDTTTAGALVPDEKTLAAVPFALTGRAFVAGLTLAEMLLLGPFVAAALSGILLERRFRPLGLLVGFLAWASLGPHTPALPVIGRPPALRVVEWLPGMAEFHLPLLFAVAAAACAVGLGARFLSGATPPVVGLVAALGVAALPLRALDVGALFADEPSPASRHLAASRILAWPLDFESVEAALTRVRAGQRVANLDSEVLFALAEHLPERPSLFWSERFHDTLDALGIGLVRLGADPGPLPDFVRPTGGDARLLRVDAEARRERARRLEALEPAGWTGTSSALGGGEASAAKAFDGRRDTRWGSGEAQGPGQFFELDLGLAVSGVTRVEIDVGIFESDRPRSLRVETTENGIHWREVAAEPRPPLGEKRLTIDFPPTRTRAVKLTQLGRDRVLDWSIAEIRLWRDPER